MATKRERDLINAYGVQEDTYNENEVNVIQATERVIPQNNDVPAKQNMSSTAEAAREKRVHDREGIPVTGDGSGLTYKDNLGWLRIEPKSLPTEGLFYPVNISIKIRAARGEEIKHWSTMNDQDIESMSRTDDILSYMIEKCCSVEIPGRPGNCWRDLKNVDRMYILLSIREFTFLDGDNELMVPVSEGQDIAIVKEMIDFVNIPENIMKHYDAEQRCFVFNIKNSNSVIKIYIPSIGVNNWIKMYAAQKEAAREGYDIDFLSFAPMLVEDYRKLTVQSYEDLVGAARQWGHKEWSVVSYVTNELSNASRPMVKYNNSDGQEVEIPLSFRGGLRSIFLLSDPLQSVC